MLIVADQTQRGFGPSQSKVLDRMLMRAGVARSEVKIITPEQWQPIMARYQPCVVLAGEQAAQTVLKWPAPPDTYHGSVLPEAAAPPTSWNAYVSWCESAPKYVVTFAIDKLHAMWDWHPLAQRDWEKAGWVERGRWQRPQPLKREWVLDQPKRLVEMAKLSVLAFDTELTPSWMFGACNSQQVHVFEWNRDCAQYVKAVMQQGGIVKVAHNLQHDLAMCDLRFGVEVKPPYFDTYGGAHILNTALERTLSPGIASRFTNWPYHKWLANYDMQRYNGMDNIVCFDAWAEIVQQLSARGLEEVARHDHQLLTVLYAMQKQGFRVDAKARQEYEEQAQGDLILAEEKLQELAQPIIIGKIARFKKPSLFRQQRKCKCCGGGKASRDHCWRCGGLKQKPKKKVDFVNTRLDDGTRAYLAPSGKMYWLPAHKTSELKAKLPACNACLGNGKVYEWLEFNPGSSDQVGDVVYRGLGITPRRYKGKETTNAAALSKIADKHPLIAELVATSKLRADISTVERLLPGTDGKLHCVFDPWGTESGRVAGKEGLLQAGTNPMNIPKAARRFVVPDAGYILMYPDMAQIEARVVAKLSEKYDSKLMLAFTKPIDWPGHEKHGKIDSHTFVQQLVSRWVEITRDQAKRLTYAAMYGVSGKQLAVELTAEAHRRGGAGMVNEQQGTAMLEAFFLAFPGVRQWHAAVEQEVMQSRTVVSLSGRERHWPGRVVDRKTGGITREILKQAWSFVPQDVGAWVLAEGIIAVANDKRCQDMDVQLMVHVHDAVLMQVPERYLPEAIYRTAKLLSRTMYGMWFPCEMKTGSNWYKVS